MKRKQPIQPAPQALKPTICPCGVEAHIQHVCSWRPAARTAPSALVRRNDHQRDNLPRLEVSSHAGQLTEAQKRFLVMGGLPSARRKSKALASPNGLVASAQRQVRLKGMPVDVFHPEPFNAYPIPTIGVVHRMIEHCELLQYLRCNLYLTKI
jgi:hypothetical protein